MIPPPSWQAQNEREATQGTKDTARPMAPKRAPDGSQMQSAHTVQAHAESTGAGAIAAVLPSARTPHKATAHPRGTAPTAIVDSIGGIASRECVAPRMAAH
jgi:hypothetical protein